MFSTNVPKLFWGEAVLTAAYLINRMPSRVLKFQTPCQSLLKSFPTTRLISIVPPKIFGCSVFVHINQQHRSKLDPRSLKCIFLGYSANKKGISVTLRSQENSTIQWMSHFLKPSLTIPKLIFRGRIQLRNISFGTLSN